LLVCNTDNLLDIYCSMWYSI